MSNSCAICVCVYKSEQYLPKLLDVVSKTAKMFSSYNIFFAFDNAGDNSRSLLLDYLDKEPNAKIIPGGRNPNHPRVFNIAQARNNCLSEIRCLTNQPTYFIMIDANYSVQTQFRPYILEKHLERSAEWDALSFNRKPYYDEWALSLGNHKISIWHLSDTVRDSYRENMRKELHDGFSRVGKGNYLSVDSAFCGYGIYKTNVFINYNYSPFWRPDLLLTSQQIGSYMKSGMLRMNVASISDCEHRNFHAEASIHSGARIMIANDQLFAPEN
jgi:glycosyltransferase involved in cell wall biosynthesis